jgi:hypothetical protein
MHTLQTSGVKADDCADSACGAWSYLREYYLWLPPDYDENTAYPLLLEAPGCSSSGNQVYPLLTENMDTGSPYNAVIRVGLTPPPDDIGHATHPNQGCFDDQEGDDSVDFVFYETLIDQLETEICYDQNRAFAVGNSSGARLANELACKYAGDTRGYALSGVAAHEGGLPTDASAAPTCSGKPFAGIWACVESGATDSSSYRYAISHTMQTNGCDAPDFDFAQLVPYSIDSSFGVSSCNRILGCPEQYPLVVCQFTSMRATDDGLVNPTFATFIQSLAKP